MNNNASIRVIMFQCLMGPILTAIKQEFVIVAGVEFSFYNFKELGDLFHINSYIVFLHMNKIIIRTNIFLKIMVTIATIRQIVT